MAAKLEEPRPLPPGLDLLWGRRPASRRGPKPELDVDRIVAAAVAVANAEGLEAVSMARVARDVGFTAMALYRHVASKDELLQLMWNASAQGVEDWSPEGDTWRERLLSWALTQREVIDRNRWIVQMPMATPPLAPNSLAWIERGLDALAGTGLDGATALRVLGLISQYALIEARMRFDEERGRAAAEQAGSESDYLTLVRELADPITYPRLSSLAADLQTASEAIPGHDPLAEFLFDVNLILDGVERLLQKREP